MPTRTMSIQWFPGHMTKARREMAEAMPKQDVVIEVLDARMPQASENPLVYELRGQKPCIKVLSKSDLADPVVTAAWIRYFESRHDRGRVVAIALTTRNLTETRTKIPALCKELALHPKGPGKTPRAMVVGIPNVGKSTLINTLMERNVANVGDKPAVTKSQQLVMLKNGMALYDNPGVLWPKIEDPEGGLRIAFGGAIPDTAIDFESVALFGASYLRMHYPALLRARYKITDLPDGDEAVLEEIGRKRGCLKPGGRIDMHKAAAALIHDFRSGVLGRISLETPDTHRQAEVRKRAAADAKAALALAAESALAAAAVPYVRRDAVSDLVPDSGTEAGIKPGRDAAADGVPDSDPNSGPDAVPNTVPDGGPDFGTPSRPDRTPHE